MSSTALIKNIQLLFTNPNAINVSSENLNFPFQCYFVGGRLENIKEVILPALRKELGMNLVLLGHKDPSKKSYPIIPFNVMLVFHLKDLSSHPIREWAKKETEDMGIPFIEIVQKIKPSLEIIQKHYPIFWAVSQRFTMLRNLLPAEECKREDEFYVFTVENFINDILVKPDWISLENNILSRPYLATPVNTTDRNNKDFYRDSIKIFINEALSNSESVNNKPLEPLDNPRVEDWYVKGSNLLADKILEKIQGKSKNKEEALEIKRSWLSDMITDSQLDSEWTKNLYKVDLAFKAVFGCGIPSILKNEVKDMLDMKHQDLNPKPIKEEPLMQEEPIIMQEEPIKALVEEPIMQEEQPVEEQHTSYLDTLLIDDSPAKTISINGMNIQMIAGSTLHIENIIATNLDLKECRHVYMNNVNGNLIGEMKITF